MSLEEAKLFKQDPIALFDVDEAIRGWQATPPSMISHHGLRCCALAREWIFSTDQAQLNSEHLLTGPRWLRQRFTWGPSPWPIAWCEVVKRKVLDCGAFAALACEVFSTRGIRSFRAQVIQEFSEQATMQWMSKWTAEQIAVDWITPGLIYHEVCAVETAPQTIRLWDASAGWWIDARRVEGYAMVRALRIFAETAHASADQLIFDRHTVIPNKWQALKVAAPSRMLLNPARTAASPIEIETTPAADVAALF
jgi:hypothetical protein